MGFGTVTFKELTNPKNRAKVEQSLSLIERGKAGIAGRDPALRRFVNTLVQLGVRDLSVVRTALRKPVTSGVPEPTPTEIALGQSLPAGVRDQPLEQVRGGRSFIMETFPGTVLPGVSRQVFRDTGQTLGGFSSAGAEDFQGPVPPGVSRQVFRDTGQTGVGGAVGSVQLATELIDTRTARARGIPGYASATVEFFKIGGETVGKAFGFIEGDFESPLDPFRGRGVAKGDRPFTKEVSLFPESEFAPKFFKNVFTPLPFFRDFGKLDFPTDETRREAKERVELESGISPDLIGLPPGARRSKVIGDVEKGITTEFETVVGGEITDLHKGFQERIDVGDISLSQAEIQFEKEADILQETRRKDFQIKFEDLATIQLGELGIKEKISLKDRQFRDLGVTSGDIFADVTPKVLETGAIIGASFTPVGATIAGGFLLGTSAKDFGRGILGKDLTISERAVSISKGGLEAGVGGLFIRSALGPQRIAIEGLGGEKVSIPSNLLERQFQKEQFKELGELSTKLVSVGKPKPGDGFIETRLVGGRKAGTIREDLDITLKTFPKGVVAGGGISDVTFKTVFGEDILLSRSFKLGTKFPPTVVQAPIARVSKGLEITTEKIGTGAFGTGTIRFAGKSSFTEFGFVGVSAKGPGGIQGISGRQTLVRIPKIRREIIEGVPFDIKADVPFSIRGRKDVFTLIQQPSAQKDFFRQVIQRGQRGKPDIDLFGRLDTSVQASNVQTALQQQEKLLSTGFGAVETGIVSKVHGATLKSAQASIISQKLPGPGAFGVLKQQPSPFGGTGLFEKTDEVAISLPGIKQQLTLTPKLTGKDRSISFLADFSLSKDLQKEFNRFRFKTGQAFGQITPSRLGQIQPLVQPQLERLRLGQRLKLKRIFKFDTPPLPLGFEPFGGFGRGRFGFLLFPPPSPRVTTPRRGRAIGKRRLKRTPSFISILTGFEAPGVIAGEETGLIARPLIRKRKKKRGGKK